MMLYQVAECAGMEEVTTDRLFRKFRARAQKKRKVEGDGRWHLAINGRFSEAMWHWAYLVGTFGTSAVGFFILLLYIPIIHPASSYYWRNFNPLLKTAL